MEPGRALDLGCGTGTTVLWLAQQGWTAVGVDFSSLAIESARRKADWTSGASTACRSVDETRTCARRQGSLVRGRG